MIEPTEADIGRRALYYGSPSYRAQSTRPPEEGVITSFNDSYVFLRYGTDGWSKATRREDLEWLSVPETGETG